MLIAIVIELSERYALRRRLRACYNHVTQPVKFSALVDAVERSDTVKITKHGKPAAAIIPLDLAAQFAPQKLNFAEFLKSVTTDFEFNRTQTPERGFEL